MGMVVLTGVVDLRGDAGFVEHGEIPFCEVDGRKGCVIRGSGLFRDIVDGRDYEVGDLRAGSWFAGGADYDPDFGGCKCHC